MLRPLRRSTRLSQAKEIFWVLTPGHGVSPAMHTCYKWVLCILRVACCPGTTQVPRQGIWQHGLQTSTTGPAGRVLHTMHLLSWEPPEGCRSWCMRDQTEPLHLVQRPLQQVSKACEREPTLPHHVRARGAVAGQLFGRLGDRVDRRGAAEGPSSWGLGAVGGGHVDGGAGSGPLHARHSRLSVLRRRL